MARISTLGCDDARALAGSALGYLAGDMDRLGRFLAITGIEPRRIREAAREPGFLAGVLDHILADEALTIAFAEHEKLAPERIGEARSVLDRPDCR